MRVVIATQEGIFLDSEDIAIVRIGHGNGIELFTTASEVFCEHYENCGIEWRMCDGRTGRLAGAEALIQMSSDGLLAIACIAFGTDRFHGHSELLLSAEMEEKEEIEFPMIPWDGLPEPEPERGFKSWIRNIFRGPPAERNIFSIRQDLPREFFL